MTKTRFITTQEFETMKVYELDNVTYRKIEMAFIKNLGEIVGKKIFAKYLERTVRELTKQNMVEVMSYINII